MKKYLVFFFVMLHLVIPAKPAFSYDYNWADYTEPYNTTVNVPLHKGSTVYVDLPADYIRNNSSVSLHLDLQSNLTYRIDGLEQKGFEGFFPKVSVNGGAIFGQYTIPVKALPMRQITMISIKTKYLKTGKNGLKFFVGRKSDIRYSCQGGKICIGFYIQKIWFDDFESTKKATNTQLNLTKKEPLPSTFREKVNIEGSFEGEPVNMHGWNFGDLFQQGTGKGGFQKIYIDEDEGAKGTNGCLAMDFKLGSKRSNQLEERRPPVALLRNALSRDLSAYTGVLFHIKATKDLTVIFGLADSETDNSEEERWNHDLSVTTGWKEIRIPFNSLSLALRRALMRGTNQILELNRSSCFQKNNYVISTGYRL